VSAWNGQDLAKGTPSLGFTLASAHLIPGFVRQALEGGLFTDTLNTQITPLDDLKQWMREDPWREGELFGLMGDLLLGDEKKARKAAEKAGVEFDVVGFELEQMTADDSYESLTPEWAARCFELVVDEADAINAWSHRSHGLDLALAISFQLPDPGRNPKLSRESIGAVLARHGASKKAVAAVMANKKSGLEFSGAFQLDLCPRTGGKAPSFSRVNNVAFVTVPISDSLAGDETLAYLSLAYPIEAEGYFLLTFDALRQSLTLRDAGADVDA
jgi:hypothetical protein